MGDAVSTGLTNAWNTISSSIWDKLIEWIYKAIFDALADFFTLMSGMGLSLFDLLWIKSVLQLFSMFGWALFVCVLTVCIFDVAIESQSQGRVNVRSAAINCLKGFLAVNLFTIVPIELYKFCVSLQNIFARDLSGIFVSQPGGIDGIVSAAKIAIIMIPGGIGILGSVARISEISP